MGNESALGVQIGGGHYKDMPIQPIEFCFKNNLNVCQSKVIKYVCRYKKKNGREDLEKAKHMIDLLIELEYANGKITTERDDRGSRVECVRSGLDAQCSEKYGVQVAGWNTAPFKAFVSVPGEVSRLDAEEDHF